MRRIVSAGAALLCFCFFTGAPESGYGDKPAGDNLYIEGGELILDSDTNKRQYAEGEAIEMSIEVTNISGKPSKIRFTTYQCYDFIIEKGGRVLWRWSDDKPFRDLELVIWLSNKQKLLYKEKWDGRVPVKRHFLFFEWKEYGPIQPGKYWFCGVLGNNGPRSKKSPLIITRKE